jgi:phosphatidylserine decarboxylase
VAREGLPFIIGGLGVALVLIVLAQVFPHAGTALWTLGMIVGLFGVFSLYFFRDPVRTAPDGEGIVVSPGDGKVISIVTEDDQYAGEGAIRVSVFLSVFDVHINRNPISGVVRAVKYNPGKFLAAFNEKASMDNEQVYMSIEGDCGAVSFKLIAGLIARRIVYRLSEGDTVDIGARCGLIRFGSRVDVIVPAGSEIAVAKGQRVKGGESVIATLPPSSEKDG